MLAFLLLSFVGAAGAHALPALALLPATGEGPREQRIKLDAAIRKAVVADGNYSVQNAKETSEQIAFMAEQGIICTSTDVPCLQRLGILCGAQFLLVPEAKGERELEVSMILLGVEDGVGVVRTVSGDVNLANATAKTLTLQALHGGGDVEPDLQPIRDPGPVITPPDQPIDETKLNDLQFAGATVGTIGGSLAGLTMLGALTCEAIYWTGTGPAETRETIFAVGGVLWIATIVGALAAGTGAGIFLVGAPAEDSSLAALQ